MCPSAFRISSPPGPGWRGRGSNLHQNLPWTGGDVCAKFHHYRCRGLDFHIPTDKQTNICRPIFINIEDRWNR